MKTIRHTSTLFYYDGAQVFEARDRIGGHYLAMMVEPEDDLDRYVIVGVEPEQLRQFRSGTVDLRSLLIDSSKSEWYLTTVETGLEAPLPLVVQTTSLLESDLLPEPGFLLQDLPTNSEVVQEARERNNLVLDVAVEPPEAAEQHRIRVSTLVGLLGHVQTLVKHAYGAALRGLSLETRRSIDRSDAHLLDVVIPAAPGSFRVVMEAAKTPDLIGESELARALNRIDELFQIAGNPQESLEIVKSNRGHFAGAYLRLLRFLVQNKTGLRYSWAQPISSKPISHIVTEKQLGPLVEALSGIANLGVESVELTGALEKADNPNGKWGISTPEGSFSGKIKEGGPSLLGLKIGSSYHFSCIEEIEELEGTGREQRTLYLIDHEPM